MPKLNYKTYGQGYPIIILHGLFGSLDNWQTIAKRLAENYMVYTIDQRDHGRSPKTDDFSYALLSEDLYHFMEEHWIHEAHIIGHSMGGKTLMTFALEYPEKLKKGIVVDIGPQKYIGGHSEIMKAMSEVDLEITTTRTEINNVLKNRIGSPGVIQFLAKNFARRKKGGFELKINLPLLMNKYDNINIEIEGDISDSQLLFVKGELSNYLHHDDITEIQTLFPNSKMVSIPNAGHWVHAEQPLAFFDEIESFLE